MNLFKLYSKCVELHNYRAVDNSTKKVEYNMHDAHIKVKEKSRVHLMSWEK